MDEKVAELIFGASGVFWVRRLGMIGGITERTRLAAGIWWEGKSKAQRRPLFASKG
jgi:hypothetical protein